MPTVIHERCTVGTVAGGTSQVFKMAMKPPLSTRNARLTSVFVCGGCCVQYLGYQYIQADAAIPDRSSARLPNETRVFQAIGARTRSMNRPSVHRPPTIAPNS